jgi:hypothetical protein
MKKVQVTIGTIWQDRGNEKKYEVTGINQETGVIQISAVGNGDGYKTMTETSLRKNYKLLAISEKKTEPVVTPEPEPAAEPVPAPVDSPVEKAAAEKSGRAAGGRVQLKDGSIIAGSKFITETCQQSREDTYKADSPIRWLLKETGQALLKENEAQIVYGEKITK